MGNLVWATAIAGGAALLGAAIAFGMVKDHPRRTTSISTLRLATIASITRSASSTSAAATSSGRHPAAIAEVATLDTRRPSLSDIRESDG